MEYTTKYFFIHSRLFDMTNVMTGSFQGVASQLYDSYSLPEGAYFKEFKAYCFDSLLRSIGSFQSQKPNTQPQISNVENKIKTGQKLTTMYSQTITTFQLIFYVRVIFKDYFYCLQNQADLMLTLPLAAILYAQYYLPTR